MKVFVVTRGCYSDMSIDRVFLDEALAHSWADAHGGSPRDWDVLPFDTDEPFPTEWRPGLVAYYAHMTQGHGESDVRVLLREHYDGAGKVIKAYGHDGKTLEWAVHIWAPSESEARAMAVHAFRVAGALATP